MLKHTIMLNHFRLNDYENISFIFVQITDFAWPIDIILSRYCETQKYQCMILVIQVQKLLVLKLL